MKMKVGIITEIKYCEIGIFQVLNQNRANAKQKSFLTFINDYIITSMIDQYYKSESLKVVLA